MKKDILSRESNTELILLYERTSILRGESLRSNDPKAANRAFDEMLTIRAEMRRRDNLVLDGLLPLLKHENPWVRCDAAIPLLFMIPNEAEPVLKELGNQHGALGVIAEITLKEWRKGTLKRL